MSQAVLDRGVVGREGVVARAVRSGWSALTSRPLRRSVRRGRGSSIAHLDDRLLADAGLKPDDLGFGERLIRRYGAGGEIWTGDRSGR